MGAFVNNDTARPQHLDLTSTEKRQETAYRFYPRRLEFITINTRHPAQRELTKRNFCI